MICAPGLVVGCWWLVFIISNDVSDNPYCQESSLSHWRVLFDTPRLRPTGQSGGFGGRASTGRVSPAVDPIGQGSSPRYSWRGSRTLRAEKIEGPKRCDQSAPGLSRTVLWWDKPEGDHVFRKNRSSIQSMVWFKQMKAALRFTPRWSYVVPSEAIRPGYLLSPFLAEESI